MKQYNGVPLDGRSMKIQLATSEVSAVSAISPRRLSGGVPRKRSFDDRRRSGGRVEKPRRGAAGGRGGKRGGRGGRGGKKAAPPSAEGLDKELDSYRNSK